jgi:hypothetical protein
MSWSWASDPSAPAWVQAIGSILAILIAITIPAWQRRKSQNDAKIERAREGKERLKRLVAGLRAEVNAAIEVAAMHRATAESTLSKAKNAAQAGSPLVIGENPFSAGSTLLTDAIVYRSVALELGHFPADIVHHIVMFYSNIHNLGRLVEMASSVFAALELVRDLTPRAQMNGMALLELLDKFRQADFASNADLRLDPKQRPGDREADRIST